MTDNKWIEEDWEREFLKDEIYSIEKKMDLLASWQEEEYKPAIVKLIIYDDKPSTVRANN